MRTFLRLLLIVCAFFPMSSGLLAQNAPPALFLPAPAQTLKPIDDRTIRATKAVTVNWNALQSFDPVLGSTTLSMQTLDGKTILLLISRIERRSDRQYTLFGNIVGEPTSLVLLTVYENALSAVISLPGKFKYTLRLVSKGNYVLAELDDSKFPPCGVKPDPRLPIPSPPASAQIGVTATAEIDILIVYTFIARLAMGGVDQAKAICQQAVDATNVAYLNSGVDARMRLVRTEEFNYDEVGTYTEHLNRLISTNDGVMDIIHDWRNFWGADLVSLFVNDGSSGGLAPIMNVNNTSFASQGFSVVNWGAAVGNLTLAHETGHNMGCGHANGDANAGDGSPATGLFSYSRGWRFTGTDNTPYRTVMAYSPGTRVGYFSNPSVSFAGRATGVANSADNALTLRQTVGTASLFRTPLNDIYVDFGAANGGDGTFSRPCNRIEDGQARVRVGGNLWLRGTSPITHPFLLKPMFLRNYNGDALVR